jgi:hypothetical protein
VLVVVLAWFALDRIKLAASNQELLQILRNKEQLLDGYLDMYSDRITRIQTILTTRKSLSEKLAVPLSGIQKASLLTRVNYWHKAIPNDLHVSLRVFWRRLTAIFSPEAWHSQWQHIKKGAATRWVLFFVLLTVIWGLGKRLRNLLQRFDENEEGLDQYYRQLGLRILRRSLALLGLVLCSVCTARSSSRC